MNTSNNRQLPRNICRHPDGYLIRIQRGEVLYQAFVSYNWKPARLSTLNFQPSTALARAIELRDGFLKIAGEIKRFGRPHRRAHSNTGIVGISETVHWSHSVPRDCFCVSWSVRGRGHTKRVIFGPERSRESALAEAIALRARMTRSCCSANPEATKP